MNYRVKSSALLLVALLMAGSAGCSFSMTAQEDEGSAKPEVETLIPADPSPNPAARTAAAISQSQNTSTVEVLWEVPGEAVEKYHLYYGFDAAHLDNHVEVPVAELQKIDHPKHGPVFRYELKQIPANKAIFLSLRAENKSGISDPSTPTKVEPGQTTVTP